ncbi:hypothetical protein ACIBBD_05435 [Streptomyces sp. NPDC051315]|uniref:hypothetical protein n=1 Tax=Streptomyces sp. NPDC051315 TaxID=3365650 RepID=UPI0037A1AAFC
MRVEMIQRAADVLFDVPEDVHKEILMLIEAVAEDRTTHVPDIAVAFGEWCWLVYTRHGDVIEIRDVGCAR